MDVHYPMEEVNTAYPFAKYGVLLLVQQQQREASRQNTIKGMDLKILLVTSRMVVKHQCELHDCIESSSPLLSSPLLSSPLFPSFLFSPQKHESASTFTLCCSAPTVTRTNTIRPHSEGTFPSLLVRLLIYLLAQIIKTSFTGETFSSRSQLRRSLEA